MSEEKPELTKVMYEVVSKAAEIKENEHILDEKAKELLENYTPEGFSQFSNLYDESQKIIQTESKRITDMFLAVEKMIAQSEKGINKIEIPSAKKLQENFSKYSKNPSLPTQAAPYVPLTGSSPWPQNRILPNNSYVVVVGNKDENGENIYCVAVVLGFDPYTLSYYCCDADPTGDVPQEFIVPYKEIMPLPQFQPARRTKATTYKIKTDVLAAWPEFGSFTSVFYPAVVVAAPTTIPGKYRLRFEGSPPLVEDVPEKLIVEFPKNKKK
ncbi:hypothetical protein TVAG_006000 [Trichomonas vaginalis G3]|uniref:SGF29 C-terminal domain-containing protein n=1 Tax=Trichomonas vaginalis (strain ATCC PRA-98 / G3) TaxID=412133 RepID=A2E707_TRIV3|nr:SAGA-associateD factor 29 family [Trichomonas vaginalis G3]EAY11525.1 hypothetical protein TVAG_006000 [Trichomonas vaginalis G3]KAI5489409.1 SAGA-associateD factor 29 family [Trichomonas vaginalis G3]|eukprot:XP_001323748.1 hypothetical protein [Trichomonas vaginalis G3]